MPALIEVASEKLHALDVLGRRRTLRPTDGREGVRVLREGRMLISFSCNDYLGLSAHPAVCNAASNAIQQHGTGAQASRAVTGSHALYRPFEEAVARWRGTESALVFGSGYLANLGAVASLAGRGDLILADRLVHACLLDGAKLSGARLVRFRHNDLKDCARLLRAHRAEFRHCLILTEDVFSMDGDRTPMAALAALAREHDAWLLSDGAHDLVPHGGEAGPDIRTGTLSKTLGGYGGYVAGPAILTEWLASTARSFLFSTGLPPATIAGAQMALQLLQADPGMVERPLTHARRFAETLRLPRPDSQIVPMILLRESRTLAAAAALEEAGFLVAAIRPPTVPEGTSRLRFTFSALHSEEDVAGLIAAVKSLRQRKLA